VDNLWATKIEDVGLIDRTISFQDFQPMWSWSTNVTDGQTDGQTTCDHTTALCTRPSASCGKKYLAERVWENTKHKIRAWHA